MTRHVKKWPVNGANVKIFSSGFWMNWNSTLTRGSQASRIWECFQTQRWPKLPILNIFNLILLSFELPRIIVPRIPDIPIHIMVMFIFVLIAYVIKNECHACQLGPWYWWQEEGAEQSFINDFKLLWWMECKKLGWEWKTKTINLW